MQLTSRQHHILDDLGITVWQRRDKPAVSPAAAEDSSDSGSASVEVGGELLLITNSRLDGEKQLLLGAMLKSVALTLEQVTVLNGEQFQQVSAQDLEQKPVLVLGEAVAADAAPAPFYACPELDQMLQQPRLKASAWQVLKQLKTAF